jgi:hypothetical protein
MVCVVCGGLRGAPGHAMPMLRLLAAATATATAAAGGGRRPNLLFLASDGVWLSSPPSSARLMLHAAPLIDSL